MTRIKPHWHGIGNKTLWKIERPNVIVFLAFSVFVILSEVLK